MIYSCTYGIGSDFWMYCAPNFTFTILKLLGDLIKSTTNFSVTAQCINIVQATFVTSMTLFSTSSLSLSSSDRFERLVDESLNILYTIFMKAIITDELKRKCKESGFSILSITCVCLDDVSVIHPRFDQKRRPPGPDTFKKWHPILIRSLQEASPMPKAIELLQIILEFYFSEAHDSAESLAEDDSKNFLSTKYSDMAAIWKLFSQAKLGLSMDAMVALLDGSKCAILLTYGLTS